MQVLPGHADPITSIAFDLKGELIASASYEGFCRLWEVGHSCTCLASLTLRPESWHAFSLPPLCHLHR